ncbi:MAG: gliding motility-associated ABC transporter ATP-binding subunit GldA [Cytophagales bacterium]|nr:gliding motility-associated ABC transporter ATP-binding subunit GldA [Cytophagales bacterium]MDW8383912.1 gliding motility-associated ABC transporter ATP-binding subunit GldA [Flammeovirgaceae bacterium]
MLQVEHLTKIYNTQKAVDNISFVAQQGEIVGFLGPNGAGKSTTMKIATGYLAPTSGSIKVCGYDILTQTLDAQRCVGYLPEHNPLYTEMYVREYLIFCGKLQKMGGKQLHQRIEEVIELVGLQSERRKKIKQLSKGYRQRVGLAQALLHNPPVLILDEPTTGLDPNQIVEIRNLIKNISAQKTVILSTHIMQEVQAICQRVIIIHAGKIVANSSIKDLLTQKKQIRIEFATVPPQDLFSEVNGIEHIAYVSEKEWILNISPLCQEDIRPFLFQKAVENGQVLLSFQLQTQNIENIFRQVTT